MNGKSKKDDLFDLFLKDMQQPFSGWDFSYISHRIVTSPLNWSYSSIVIPYIRVAESLLDMGTGGGEYLQSLQPLPKNTCATESYPPNIPIAKRNLEPLGIKVYAIKDNESLPFADNQFDLIFNRHEDYHPLEVLRILKPKCFFITQQVGGHNDLLLNKMLESKIDNETLEFLHWNLKYAIKQLQKVGFIIIKKMEAFPITRCFDIGAIIYLLKAIPWQIPDFTIERYYDKLRWLHQKIMKKGYVDIRSHRFLIKAQKRQ